KCWKEHTCVGCGGVFRYLFVRTKVGQGANEAAATAAARKAVVNALGQEVEQLPCPDCGLYQPDMVAVQRSRRHWYLLWASLAFLAVPIFLGLVGLLPYSLVAWIAAAAGAMFLAGHLVVDWLNPNRSLGGNQERARQAIEAGSLAPRSAGDPNRLEP